jgi:hypothetical protein
MLTQIIEEVPDDIFLPALHEISAINWSTIIDTSRNNKVFSTSTSIHLRGHKIDHNNTLKKVEDYCKIVECVDTKIANNYPLSYNVANWILKKVNGKRLGRIMIVKLEAGGSVGLHVDPLDYFDVYARYHVPVKTTEQVVFSGGDNVYEHMPYKMLSRLNNRKPHMLDNNGSDYRTHLIVDVEIEGGNNIF